MALYDEIMAGILEKNAGYGYDDDVVEALEARDELLKTAADILETVDEIDYSLGLEKGAGIGSKALIAGAGALGLGALGLPYWKWYSHSKQRRKAEERLRKLQNRGFIDRIRNKDV